MRHLYLHLLICHLFTLTVISATPDSELLSKFAAMNQKALQDFQDRNPGVYLYSLIPLDQKEDYFRDFQATFFNSDSRRITYNIRYIKMNNIWQIRTRNIYDPEKVRESNFLR